MIAIRDALQSDRDDVLSFCANTFSWGDYIDQVWDLWLNDDGGRLLVASEEPDGTRVGLSHVAACPDSKSIWLEGIRVRPSHRRAGIATALIEEMLDYGRKNGAATALAIVAKENAPSQKMMEQSGFSVISEWAYYASNSGGLAEKQASTTTAARIASEGELGVIMDYLDNSRIYGLSAKKYVNSWRWYPLDLGSVRRHLIDGRIVVAGTSPLAGLAVVNRTGYWSRRNVLQIVYLDSESESVLRDILAFVTGIFADDKYERLQVLFPQDKNMTSAVQEFQLSESEQFLLYSKVFTG